MPPILKDVSKKMKRKYCLVILFLLLAMFLSGCGSSGIEIIKDTSHFLK